MSTKTCIVERKISLDEIAFIGWIGGLNGRAITSKEYERSGVVIFGMDVDTYEKIKARVELKVCKRCLLNINYHNINERLRKKAIVENFSLESFSEQFQTSNKA